VNVVGTALFIITVSAMLIYLRWQRRSALKRA
jgi:hypothetical protein